MFSSALPLYVGFVDVFKKTTKLRGTLAGSFSPSRSNPLKVVINLNAGCRPIEFKTDIFSLLIAWFIISGQQARNMLCRVFMETGHTGDICGLIAVGCTFIRGGSAVEVGKEKRRIVKVTASDKDLR